MIPSEAFTPSMGKRGELKPHASWKGERTGVGLDSLKKKENNNVKGVIKVRKRKLITALGMIVLDIILFCIGSFYILWGVWNYLFGTAIGATFGLIMMVIGGFVIIVGIIVVLKLVALLSPKTHSTQKSSSIP